MRNISYISIYLGVTIHIKSMTKRTYCSALTNMNVNLHENDDINLKPYVDNKCVVADFNMALRNSSKGKDTFRFVPRWD
jgi:hypothetical protein